MRFIVPLSVLCLFTITCHNPNKKNILGNFYTFKYYTVGIKLANDQAISSNHKVTFSKKDSLNYTFMFTDTGLIEIEIWDLNKEQIIHKKWFQVFQHPKYSPDWENWNGEIVEGILEDQYSVFTCWRKSNQIKTHQKFPKFTLNDAMGNLISNKIFEGKTTHVNTWYYGCLPCMAEIPYLNQLESEFRGDTNVQFISFFKDSIIISNGEMLYTTALSSSSYRTLEEIDNKGFNYRQIPNSESFLTTNGLISYPQNLIINRTGEVVFHSIGARENDNSTLITDLKKQIILSAIQ